MPVVGESAVMRFVATFDRRLADNFAVVWRARFYINRDKFIRAELVEFVKGTKTRVDL